MFIRFGDYTEQIRNYLDNIVDDMCSGLCAEKQDEIIDDYFNDLKEKNYTFYQYLIGMLFTDHYKLLRISEKYDDLDEDDEIFLKLYNDFYSLDDILNYVEEYPNALASFLYNMSEFNSYNYFEKREAWLSCKDELDFLKKFSPLNIFDYLYYCQKYNIAMLKSIYDDYTKIDKSLVGSFETIKSTLNELGLIDEDNYFELASDLLTLYYAITKDEFETVNDNKRRSKLSPIIKKIEDGNYSEILSYMDNDKFLDEILMQVFTNENRELSQDFDDDDTYNETLKKLKSIKSHFK